MISGTNLKYSKDHEWVDVNGEVATIGITNYAQVQLGDIVYVELPEIGIETDRGEAICAVESVKTATDVLTPVSGKVVEVNDALEETPEIINSDAYSSWMVKIQMSDLSETEGMMNEEEYAVYCKNEG